MTQAFILPPAEGQAPQGRQWSSFQLAIFDAVENTHDNLVVEALAGSGKSTTLEEIAMRTCAGDSVAIFAFNKSIADAMKERFRELDPAIKISTLHSFGFSVLRSISSSFALPKWSPTSTMTLELLGRGSAAKKARDFVNKLVSRAKGALCPLEIDALADLALESEIWVPRGESASKLLSVARKILEVQSRKGRRAIDFDDMIWLPVIWGLEIPRFDFVLVDEWQDMNPCQQELAMSAAEGGRLVAVGDRHQSIYQFRGADSQAMQRVIEASKARVLPLSITYRCARAIVEVAQEYVPELQAREGAPEGTVRTASEDELFEGAQPGDFVISRTNAPLIKLAYEWLRAGVPCEIRGRNIGADLVSWIESLKARSLGELEVLVHAWLKEQAGAEEQEEGAPRSRKADAAYARAECVLVLAKEPGIESVSEIVEKLEEMFADSEGGDATRITLSSTHRAKGLEAERVWVLRDTFRPGESQEETNLMYVACTRAKSELVFVEGEEQS